MLEKLPFYSNCSTHLHEFKELISLVFLQVIKKHFLFRRALLITFDILIKQMYKTMYFVYSYAGVVKNFSSHTMLCIRNQQMTFLGSVREAKHILVSFKWNNFFIATTRALRSFKGRVLCLWAEKLQKYFH